jgi:hypothetical protein
LAKIVFIIYFMEVIYLVKHNVMSSLKTVFASQGTMVCQFKNTETEVLSCNAKRAYDSALRNIPEERRSHLH